MGVGGVGEVASSPALKSMYPFTSQKSHFISRITILYFPGFPFSFPEVSFCFRELHFCFPELPSFYLLCVSFSKNAFFSADCTFSSSYSSCNVKTLCFNKSLCFRQKSISFILERETKSPFS